MKLLIALTFATGLLTADAQAQADRYSGFYSGNELQTLCTEPTQLGTGTCLGFIAAVADALASGEDTVRGHRACIPTSVTTGQAADVVRQFFARNPQSGHLSAISLVANALSEAFPCR